MHRFTLDWPPTVNTYWRQYVTKGVARVLLSERGRKYKERAALQLMSQGVVRELQGRVSVLIDAYVPDYRKRDLDNILKPLLDVMEDYGVFEDDEQIDILTVRRRNKEKPGRVDIQVEEIDPDDSLY